MHTNEQKRKSSIRPVKNMKLITNLKRNQVGNTKKVFGNNSEAAGVCVYSLTMLNFSPPPPLQGIQLFSRNKRQILFIFLQTALVMSV